MTEEEKIFAGKMFNARHPDLLAVKHKTHEACRLYNSKDEYDPARKGIIKEILGSIGEHYHFQGPLQFNYGKHTFMGDNVFANFNFTVLDDARVYVGDRVCFGPNVSLMATNHPLIAGERMWLNGDSKISMAEYGEEIHIGNDVWIAAGVVVIGGVHIGDGAVIGAGSVVTKDIPAGYVAFGNPCRPVRRISESDSKKALVLPKDAVYYGLR